MNFHSLGLLIFALFSLYGNEVRSQPAVAEWKNIHSWCEVPRLGYSYQGANFIEPGFGYMFVTGLGDFPLISAGPYASVDFRLGGNDFLFAPKLGLECNFIFVTGKICGAWYTNGSRSDVRLTPEIGITFLGYITCCYGYNFKLQPTSTDFVSPQKITVGLN